MTPRELRAAYERGENIMALLRKEENAARNDEGMIELSYDLQAGSYVHAIVRNPAQDEFKRQYCGAMAEVLKPLGPCTSILEAGVGEATIFKYLLDALDPRPRIAHGFDLCWSRVAVGRGWLQPGWEGTETLLSAASLTRIPYLANSFDVIFTSHAMEPNRGKEQEILAELHRVASRYVVLLEPAYELCTPEIRARMDQHCYVQDLPGNARALGFKVVKHELFPPSAHSHNPTAVTIIEKNADAAPATPAFACPQYGTPMQKMDGCYYSPDSMRAYPIVLGIPCLRAEHAIIASKLEAVAGQLS